MGRYLSLLGMVVFTLGVVALASIARTPRQPLPAPSSGSDRNPADGLNGAAASRFYYAAFSVN